MDNTQNSDTEPTDKTADNSYDDYDISAQLQFDFESGNVRD
ncbi:MAG: hypothetical protein ACKOXV_06685 [Bacteroidota bacterium]|jgi:hypothetical protein